MARVFSFQRRITGRVQKTWPTPPFLKAKRRVNWRGLARHAGLFAAVALGAFVLFYFVPWRAHLMTTAPTINNANATSGFARVIDGDTLRLNGERIRLVGIDAPEMAQTCKTASGQNWLCGQAARERLAVLASRGKAYCVAQGRDRYGRTLAACSSPGAGDFGETLVREGLALSYYGNTYLLTELSARIKGRGMWQGEFERPSNWRRAN